MMQYRFILMDNNKKAYRRFMFFLFFLHIVAAGLVGYKTGDKDIRLSMNVLVGMYGAAYVIYYFLRMKKKAFENFSFFMSLLYAGFWFNYVGLIALFIFLAVFIFLKIVENRKTVVQFSADGACLKRIFKKNIFPWQSLDNVILKDNLLTIDFKSNKLIQAEIEEGTAGADEEKFNRFCKEQLQNIA